MHQRRSGEAGEEDDEATSDERSSGLRAALRNSHLIGALFAHVPAAVYRMRVSAPRGIEFLSAQVESITGYGPERFMCEGGIRWASLIHRDDRMRTAAAVRRAVEMREPYSLEYRIVDAHGVSRWVSDRGRPAPAVDGRIETIEGAVFDVTDRKLAEIYQAEQAWVLELIGTGQPLDEVLHELVQAVEHRIPGAIVSVLLKEEGDCLRSCAAPGLPGAFRAACDGLTIGPHAGAIGAACWRREAVVTADIEHDPLWAGACDAMRQHGLRACWAEPILSGEGKVLGCIAMYFRDSCEPSESEAVSMSDAARLARVAIESHQVHEELREQLERFALAFEQAAIGIVETDVEGRLLRVNHRFCEIVEMAEEAILGRHLYSLLHPADSSFVRDMAQRLIDGALPIAVGEVRCVKGCGAQVWTKIWGSTVRDAEGYPKRLVIAMEDVSERRAAEAAMRDLNQELELRVQERTAALETSNRELESFSYSVSHDLRAPLRALDGFSLLLAEEYADRLDAQGHDYLRRIRGASQRMGELIDDLLDLARISRREILPRQVDLSDLARQISVEIGEIESQRVIEWSIAPDVQARGDDLLLRVCLDNLLRNAAKFARGRTPARISFGVDGRSGRNVYFVTDNGSGFDMKFVDKLFHPFQRLHSATAFEGTGIGLATVRRIVERHGGYVWAEGQEGVGASFYFTLG